MAFAVTSIGSLSDIADRSTYTIALSRAPDANTLVLVAVHNSSVAAVEPSSVSGAGMVFSLVTSSVTFATSRNHSVWRSMSAAPDSSVISVNFSTTNLRCLLLVTEVSGVSTSGVSGANAVGQSANSLTGSLSTMTVIAPSATSTANGWFLAASVANTTGLGVEHENYTHLDSASYADSVNGAILSAWTTLSTGTRVTVTGSSQIRAGTLVELVLDNPAAPAAPIPTVRRLRIPQVPSGLTGIVGDYLRLVTRQLNAEGYVSLFSGANPNTSGFSGVPGNLLVNIGSDSTSTRLWVMGGSAPSLDTDGWLPVRIA